MADTDADMAASTIVAVVALTVVVEAIDAAISTVLFLCTAVEAAEEIVVLGRPNLTLLTASAMMVVTEAAISEVRTRLAAKLVLELTEADAVASSTRTASTAVVMAIDALAEASTILASRAAKGAAARGLKPSMCYASSGADGMLLVSSEAVYRALPLLILKS